MGNCEILRVHWARLFNFSFFITQHMKSQLREGPIYGTLPILYVFLARTGKTVHELNFVNLDQQGNFEIAEPVNPRCCPRCKDCLLARRWTQTDAVLF